jgi:hypothetical protein
MSMLVARYHDKDVEIYRIRNGAVERVASGAAGDLEPVREWGKKVLVIGRENCLYARKKYPPLSSKSLASAIRVDAVDLFSIKEPAYAYKVFERTDTHMLVDIWAWPRSLEEEIRKVFPYRHVIPEDMAFLSQKPELTLFYGGNGVTHAVLHNSEGFVSALSFADHMLGEQQIALFLRSVKKSVSEIARINVYDQQARDVAEKLSRELRAELRMVEGAKWPASIESVGTLPLKRYGAIPQEEYLTKLVLSLRVALYLVLAYGFMLYVENQRYNRTLAEIESRIKALSSDTKVLSTTAKGRSETDLFKKIAEKSRGSRTPLAAMDFLAKCLPEDASVSHMVVSDTGINLSLSAKEPLKVIKGFPEAEPIKTVKLQGSPTKDPAGRYNFVLQLEMKQ